MARTAACSQERTFDVAGFPSANQPDNGADRDLPCQFDQHALSCVLEALRGCLLKCVSEVYHRTILVVLLEALTQTFRFFLGQPRSIKFILGLGAF